MKSERGKRREFRNKKPKVIGGQSSAKGALLKAKLLALWFKVDESWPKRIARAFINSNFSTQQI